MAYCVHGSRSAAGSGHARSGRTGSTDPAHQDELTAQHNELRSLQSELDSHRQIVSEQAEELDTRSPRIEHMKLMIEKLRQMMFGKKSEKVILKLEQLEFELEEEETTQAVMEAVLDRVSPAREAKARPERKPLPEHLEREVIPHVPGRACCPDCGGRLRQFGEDRSRRTRRQGLYLRLPAGHRARRSREGIARANIRATI
jgi:hypothetical protein